MRLQIEEWISNQTLSNEARSLMDEAVVCYKASAYKAGMLFSYLFFQTVLKERILLARRPESIPEAKWNATNNNLRSDETWDIEVSECVKRNSPFVYFAVTEDLRHQVVYWKNRRNDCAHAKSNAINASHVESFWSFLQSNLSKFVVNGGKASLLEKIKNHFDLRLTPRSADPNNIIQEIPHAIFEQDYKEFCLELHTTLENDHIFYDVDDGDHTEFWHRLFSLNSVFVGKMIEYLMENETLFKTLLLQDPSKVNYLRGKDQFIRLLWHRSEHFIAPRVFVALLRNELIPKDQQVEAINHFIESSQVLTPEELTDDEIEVLNKKGFTLQFKQIAFIDRKISSFNWANHSKRWMVIWYIKKYGLDEDVVSSLYWTFSSGSNPWHLRAAVKAMFEEESRLKDEFVLISETIEKEAPKSLGF